MNFGDFISGVQKAYVADARKDTGMREIYREEVYSIKS